MRSAMRSAMRRKICYIITFVLFCHAMQVRSMVAEVFTVKSLASMPFVQQALRSPMKPESVLSFFFGVDSTSVEGRQRLKDGTCIPSVTPLWFGGGPEYDKLCQPFAETVRAAGKGALPTWNDSTDGLAAQIILTDQLARNIFRGNPEAFLYGDVSLGVTRKLAALLSNQSSAEELYPSYLTVMSLVMMHSEDCDDHDTCLHLLEHARACTRESAELQKWWDEQTAAEMDHKVVIDRFGRYPHRNKAKNRESTEEELAWLADTDNLPGWAKS
jgi:uncharacterized protein (DUF924 family)